MDVISERGQSDNQNGGQNGFTRNATTSIPSSRFALAAAPSSHVHPLPLPPLSSRTSHLSKPMDTAADLAAPRERGGRGRAFRSRGRGRRARGRGRGATVLNGEDVPQYIEYESTARIEEIVDSDDVAPTEEVAVALVEEVEAEGSPEELLEQENGRGGRRGRGRGRGGRGRRGRRGRGRGGPPAEGEDVDAITDALAGDQVTATSEARTARQRDDRTLKQRPTHCAHGLSFTRILCSSCMRTCSLVSSDRALAECSSIHAV